MGILISRKKFLKAIGLAIGYGIGGRLIHYLGTANADYVPNGHTSYLPLLMKAGKDGGRNWPMVAGNNQRTSWTPEEVRGQLAPRWVRPIDPYINYKTQIIASDGKVFISTARGRICTKRR